MSEITRHKGTGRATSASRGPTRKLFTCRGARRRWPIAVMTAMLMMSPGGPLFVPTVHAQAPVGADFQLDAGDLRFILRQIQIAEADAAGGELFGPGPFQVNERRLPFGLRTVDGSFNHLTPGETNFGAADQLFPRRTAAERRPAEGGTSYAQKNGTVVDSQPRIISNL